MYVACPSCKTLYQIELVHLRAAGGELHCGACQTRFNATAAVFDEPQQALDYADQHPLQESVAREIDELVNKALDEVPRQRYVTGVAESESSDEEFAVVEQVANAGAGSHDVVSIVREIEEQGEETVPQTETPVQPVVDDIIFEALDELAATPTPLDELAEEPQADDPLRVDVDFYACPETTEFPTQRPQQTGEVPELSAALLYTDESHQAGLHIPWGAIAASIALAVVLLAQVAWVERYHLVRVHQLRPLVEFFCQPLDCELPLRHDISRIEMVEREVRDHPHVSGGLLINAAFINRADYAQAYPVFEVSFSDVSGTPVAVRRFPPAEYLLGQQNIDDGMAPGERAQLMLEVLDPGDRAVSFQFDFM